MGAAPADRRTRTRRRVAGACLLGLVIIGADACQPDPSPDSLEWTEVALPPGSDPRSLAALGTDVVVGGQRTDPSPAPLLLRVTAAGEAAMIPLQPHSPYAKVAELRSVASEGSRIVALGGRSGGAHGNVRWTVWSGTANGASEQPQNFYTFGGQEAGGLVDIVLTASGPLLLGSWTSETAGTDAAVWTATESTWTRQPSASTSLASTQERIVGANAAAATGKGVVIAGSVTQVDDGVRQTAHAWRASTVDGPWTSVELPGSGRRSDATSVTCGAGQCWLAGFADDRLALWSLIDGHAADVALPSTRIDADGPPPLPIKIGDQPGICYLQDDRAVVMLPGGGDRWDRLDGPEGIPIAALTVGNRLMMITRQGDSAARLWSATLPR